MRSIPLPALYLAGKYLEGTGTVKTCRTLGDLAGLFADGEAFSAMPATTPVYEVCSHLPVEEGTPGGLFFGVTSLFAGRVGDEYFMTKGHFHRLADRMEYYWCMGGEGVLLQMDDSRAVRAERMFPGSLHAIAGNTAHRVANTGWETLTFGAVWPSDAGHDYESIVAGGFAARVIAVDGVPELCF